MFASIILCGGRSSRMGRAKASLPLGGRTFLERAIDAVSQTCSVTVLATAPGQSLPRVHWNCIVVEDAQEGSGPLFGFATGLSAMPVEVESVFLTSCDSPFLKPQLIQLLFAELAMHDVAIPRIGGVLQPLLAAYRVHGLRERVSDLLKNGRRAVADLLPHFDVCELAEEAIRRIDPDLQSFRNINTPEEYAAALEWNHD